MDNIINQVFSDVIDEYQEIFRQFYPGKKSAGFNEANQVGKFLSHYRNRHPNAITWTELSFGGKTGRIDGVIIDREQDLAIYIEAKRLNRDSKIDELRDDLLRVSNSKNRFDLLGYKPANEYILLLADVWNEDAIKCKWIDEWVVDNPIVKSFDCPKIENIHLVRHRMYSFIDSKIEYASMSINKYCIAYSLYKINDRQ